MRPSFDEMQANPQTVREHYRSYQRWLAKLPIAELKHLPEAIAAFKEAGFKFMGPETVKCYLMGCGKIEPEHEPHCHRSKGR